MIIIHFVTSTFYILSEDKSHEGRIVREIKMLYFNSLLDRISILLQPRPVGKKNGSDIIRDLILHSVFRFLQYYQMYLYMYEFKKMRAFSQLNHYSRFL